MAGRIGGVTRARRPMSAVGGMRRNVEVKARLRERAEALGTALRLCRGCPGAAQGPEPCPAQGQGQGQEPCPAQGQGQEPCPAQGQGQGQEPCPGEGQGQEPAQPCPGEVQGQEPCPGEGQGQEPCPGEGQGQERPQPCPAQGQGQEPAQPCPGEGQGQEPCPGEGQVLLQTDTFFRVPRGRLKLRRTQDGRGELIFYERPDTAGPKLSSFTITPTADPEGLQAVLAQSLGVLGTVRKERLLFLLGQTRLHLDRVQGLGDFLELEVVLRPEQSVQDGQRVARELLREFGVGERELIRGAYLDLLLAQGDSGDSPAQGQPPAGHGQWG